MAFSTDVGFVFALTYGRDVDWVKNLIASDSGSLEYDGAARALGLHCRWNPEPIGIHSVINDILRGEDTDYPRYISTSS